MIQGSTVRAVMGRDDIVVWPITAANALTSPSAITRCVIHCKRDGEQDVIIDSDDVPAAFVFNEQAALRGKLANVLKWLPGIAVGEQFTESAKWKCQVFLFDAVHTSGVGHGAFWLDVVFAELPVVGAAVAYTARRDAFSPSAATTMNLTLVNTNFVPNDDGFPDAILVLSIWAFNNSGAVDTAAPTVTIGGIAASVLSVKDTGTGYVRVIAATVRVPATGLVSNAVVISYPTLVISGTSVRASVRGYYNVDPSSDGFALANIHESTIYPNPTSLFSVPAGGAVHVVDHMNTGTDFNVYADSYIDATQYTMTALQFNRGAEGYRLFSGALAEKLIPRTSVASGTGFAAVIAFVMAGTA